MYNFRDQDIMFLKMLFFFLKHKRDILLKLKKYQINEFLRTSIKIKHF